MNKSGKFAVFSSCIELAVFKTESDAQLFIDALKQKNHLADYYIIDVIKMYQEIERKCEELGVTRHQLCRMAR